jgi:Flp pilus assembly protein TadG
LLSLNRIEPIDGRGAAGTDEIRKSSVMIGTIRAALTNATRINLRAVRRFARREDGAAAVEFAIVAAPFLALMFAIMETALVFFASQTLETAVSDSARLIMTGQAQNQSFTQADFKNAVCSRIHGLFDCQSGLQIDVRTYTSFGSVDNSAPLDANGNLKTNFTYQPGGPGDIIVVRLMYLWPVYASVLGFNLGNMAGNNRLIMATAAFRNEPYN